MKMLRCSLNPSGARRLPDLCLKKAVKPEKLKDALIHEVDSHKSPGPDGNYPELCSEMTSSEPERGACC